MISKKHIIISLLITGIAIAGITINIFYSKIYRPNVMDDAYIYIPTGSDFDSVQQIVRPYLRRVKSFAWVSTLKHYPQKVKAGKYALHKGMSNNDLVNLLRSGNQTPVRVTFNNCDNLSELAGSISRQIEADSLSLYKAFTDTKFLSEHGFNGDTALCMYLPDTYEMYWNTDAAGFRSRMLKEYRKFWNTQRLHAAEKQNLSPVEVYILASIVQKETTLESEKKTVAGLYINRLKAGWALQADPTVIYAYRRKFQKDTVIKRVLNVHLETDSPYNTYLHTGLPPGPIGMPDLTTVKAVLNPEYHKYFYMCASASEPGKHVFAKTLAQHAVNRRKYQKWLKKMGY